MLFSFIKSVSSTLLIVVLSAACSGVKSPSSLVEGEKPPQASTGEPIAEAAPVPVICSALDFSNVTWPAGYSELDKMAFSLAVNITGSFEGDAGWTNLSNNFDGQGFSMGIFNQNLGQGSIQPLLIEMRDKHIDVLKKAMTAPMLESMFAMLADWEKKSVKAREFQTSEDFFLERSLVGVSSENIEKNYAVFSSRGVPNPESVSWAKNTIYSDSKGQVFKPEWKKALKEIAGDPTYISLQVKAAQKLHDLANSYRSRLAWGQVRAYLFLFDLVVQNGGLKDKHFIKFEKWLAKQGRVTEEEQMLEMLEIRVVDSNPKWQQDVRDRKTTVILGTGFVHGEDRNLPVEYCYDPVIPY